MCVFVFSDSQPTPNPLSPSSFLVLGPTISSELGVSMIHMPHSLPNCMVPSSWRLPRRTLLKTNSLSSQMHRHAAPAGKIGNFPIKRLLLLTQTAFRSGHSYSSYNWTCIHHVSSPREWCVSPRYPCLREVIDTQSSSISFCCYLVICLQRKVNEHRRSEAENAVYSANREETSLVHRQDIRDNTGI